MPNPDSLEQTLRALVDAAIRDGRWEIDRAGGRRGALRLSVELNFADDGALTSSVSSLVFEQRRHVKDGFH